MATFEVMKWMTGSSAGLIACLPDRARKSPRSAAPPMRSSSDRVGHDDGDGAWDEVTLARGVRRRGAAGRDGIGAIVAARSTGILATVHGTGRRSTSAPPGGWSRRAGVSFGGPVCDSRGPGRSETYHRSFRRKNASERNRWNEALAGLPRGVSWRQTRLSRKSMRQRRK